MGFTFGAQLRIDNVTELNQDEIEEQLRRGQHVIVQFSHPSSYESILPELNELCSRCDENLGVRFYGHYSVPFDCNTLLQIPNVKTLYVDCLLQAHNLEALAQLKHLYYLNLNVYELEDGEILKFDSLQNLKMLAIFSDKKVVNASYLKDYGRLHTLLAGGKIKNLDAIGHLSDLEYLSLNSLSKTPVHFVNGLSKLKTLKFILGGRENIEEIEENEIEVLEIVRVRGFNNFQNIANFKKLRKLLIEDQLQLSQVHFVEPMEQLEEVSIFNCKNLSSFIGLDKLPLLRTMRIVKTAVDFEEFMSRKRPDSLEDLYFVTGKRRVDRDIRKSLLKMGLQKELKDLAKQFDS